MPSVNVTQTCLLCAHPQLEQSTQLTGRDIRALWQAQGTQFPPGALMGIDDDSEIILWRCAGCGFEFFNPALAGNSLFYQCLDSSAYYTPNRPEFARTLQFATRRGLLKVLDVGCGAGAFLDTARTAGCQTYGLELTPSAAAQARAKGHQIFDRLLHELPADVCPEGFDLITLFQVLEHVPDPVAVLKQAAVRLKKGGYMSIAVPSKSGLYRFLPWDPAQWPPHHISRWSLMDFKTLAAQTGLRLVESGGDILLGTGIEQTIRTRHRLAASLGKQDRATVGSWPSVASWLYRKTGMKFIAPRWGSSIYAYYQKG